MNVSIISGHRVQIFQITDDVCHIKVLLTWFADSFHLLGCYFPEHLVWDEGFWGLRPLGWFYYLSPFPLGFLGPLNFSLISFLISNFCQLCDLGTLLTIGILLNFGISFPFCS